MVTVTMAMMMVMLMMSLMMIIIMFIFHICFQHFATGDDDTSQRVVSCLRL